MYNTKKQALVESLNGRDPILRIRLILPYDNSRPYVEEQEQKKKDSRRYQGDSNSQSLPPESNALPLGHGTLNGELKCYYLHKYSKFVESRAQQHD